MILIKSDGPQAELYNRYISEAELQRLTYKEELESLQRLLHVEEMGQQFSERQVRAG